MLQLKIFQYTYFVTVIVKHNRQIANYFIVKKMKTSGRSYR